MPVPHCMFRAGRCVFWCPLAGAESDFCGRNGRWKGLIFRHNRVFVQNQGAVLKKSSLRGVHPGDFPSRQGENERRQISCAHSSWIKRSTLLCRKMTRVHPVVSFQNEQRGGGLPDFLFCSLFADHERDWPPCVCVCFLPIYSGRQAYGHTSRGNTGGISHRISHPPSFCGAYLNFSREKDAPVPFPR